MASSSLPKLSSMFSAITDGVSGAESSKGPSSRDIESDVSESCEVAVDFGDTEDICEESLVSGDFVIRMLLPSLSPEVGVWLLPSLLSIICRYSRMSCVRLACVYRPVLIAVDNKIVL